MTTATQRRDRIRAHLDSAWELLIEAFRAGDHIELGYSTWFDYMAELSPVRPQLARADRQETFAAMLDAGMSQREIAATTGDSRETVRRSTSDTFVSDVDLDPAVPNPKPIVDPAPPISKPELSPMELLALLTKSRDTVRSFVREYDRGKPQLGDTALKMLLMAFDEIEAATTWGRTLITGSDEELSGELLDQWTKEQQA